MRLSTDQVQAIRQTTERVPGIGARVSVFGSRALDDRLGGDIDLFFETDALLDAFVGRFGRRWPSRKTATALAV